MPSELSPPTLWIGLLVLGGATALGCGPGEVEGLSSSTAAPAAPLEDSPWVAAPLPADIEAMMKRRCGGCHVRDGVAPFPLETPADIRSNAPASLHAMRTGVMPPWPPDPDCRHYEGELLMSAAEIDGFQAWVDAGLPPGDGEGEGGPLEAVAAVSVGFAATHEGRPAAPYLPSVVGGDDYRCFPLDLRIDEDSYLTASEVVPGEGGLVHHALVYAIAPERSAALDALDAATPGVGYTCFGGSEVGAPNPIGAWVPGMPPLVLEAGSGIYLRAGSRLVMQVHYNTLGVGPVEDLTVWRARLVTEPPRELLESRPFVHRDLRIPAGDPASVHVSEFVNRTTDPWEVVSVAPHMHLLGARIKVEVRRQDGGEACLVDIPRWDFNWQRSYDLKHGERVIVAPGDAVRLTCVYDNSEGAQPWIDGVRRAPVEVRWGDGTLDEMCLAFLTIARPFEAPPAMCEGFNACATGCGEGDPLDCLMGCMGADTDCALCMIPEVFADGGCVDMPCVEEMGAADGCLLTCAAAALGGEGDVVRCMEERCPQEKRRLTACSTPVLESGACDAPLVSCNARM